MRTLVADIDNQTAAGFRDDSNVSSDHKAQIGEMLLRFCISPDLQDLYPLTLFGKNQWHHTDSPSLCLSDRDVRRF